MWRGRKGREDRSRGGCTAVHVDVDLRKKGLSGEESQRQAVWRQLVNIDLHIEVGTDAEEEEYTTIGTWIVSYFN